MKKLVIILGILAVVGIIAAALVWKFYVNKPHDDIEKTEPAYSLSIEEIWRQYNSELKTADSLYTGKVIQLSGAVSRVDKNDTIVSVIFVMAADEMFGDKTISCQMYKRHNEEAQSITTGTVLKIKGFCTGYNDTDLIFNKCSIIK
ncbi:MAG: OB-fold protein [Bacteroidales bacterium]